MPNSVAQVAAAIEERRQTHRPNVRPGSSLEFRQPRPLQPQSPQIYRTSSQPRIGLQMQPQSVPGRAFAAPRVASLERVRADAAEIDMLTADLDASPRRRCRQSPGQKQGLLPSQRQQQKQKPNRPPLLKSHASFDSHRGVLFPRIYRNEIPQSAHHGHQRQELQRRGQKSYVELERQWRYEQQGRSDCGYDQQQPSQDTPYNFEYQTPPSNRKARLVDHDEAENLARKLRHVRSSESNIQVFSKIGANKADVPRLNQREHQPQWHLSPSKPSNPKTDPGAATEAIGGFEEPLSRTGFRDAEIEQTVNLDLPAPVPSSFATSGRRPAGNLHTRQQQRPHGNNDSIFDKTSALNNSRSSLGGSVLRRLEPNRVFEVRRRRNVEREWEQREPRRGPGPVVDQEQAHEQRHAKEHKWDVTRERNRARMFASVGATKSNIGAPFFSTATAAAAAAATTTTKHAASSSNLPPSSSSFSHRWWDGKRERERYGDVEKEKETERVKHWI